MSVAEHVDNTLNDREATYGDFASLAKAIQAYKSAARAAPSWPAMSAVQREVIDMKLVKMCRSLYGNPNHVDNWVDGAGYDMLAAEELGRVRAPAAAANPANPLELEQTVK
jgi:hypothetical protein